MHAALEESGMSPEHTQQFWEYVVRAAHFLVNSPDEADPAEHTPNLMAIPPESESTD
jgi:hypothetical protein